MNLQRSLDRVGSGVFAARAKSPADREILQEETFHRMISLERRRTERSRKPFLLMLLDMGEQRPAKGNVAILGKILSALAVSTRETDLAGWYRGNDVLGVMFTEIGLLDRDSIVSTMMGRLSTTLRTDLSFEQFNQIKVSFHVFPEEWNQEEPKGPGNRALYPDLSKQDDSMRLANRLKRMMDVAGSALALVLFAPLFVGIAAAIKATSKGPVFFRQQRVGQHGVPFVFLKFRSMFTGNDASTHKEYVQKLIAGKAERHPSNSASGGVFKLTKDPRITRVGAFLRRTSLDELPQFINVLQGQMSLVGPRPPLPYEVDAYDFWHRRRLLEAKPGITGLWQVSGRSRVTFDEMVRLDLRYARTWTPWVDLKILVRTPVAVVFGDGAH